MTGVQTCALPIYLVTGSITSPTAGSTPICDIRGGTPGYGGRGGGIGGAGSQGQLYIWANSCSLNSASHMYGSTVNINTSVVTTYNDTQAPSGSLSIFQETQPSISESSYSSVDKTVWQNIRPFQWIKIKHNLSEADFNYAVRIYKNDVLQTSNLPTASYLTAPSGNWSNNGVKQWTGIRVDPGVKYKFTYYAADYWGIAAENSTGVLEGYAIPFCTPMCF